MNINLPQGYHKADSGAAGAALEELASGSAVPGKPSPGDKPGAGDKPSPGDKPGAGNEPGPGNKPGVSGQTEQIPPGNSNKMNQGLQQLEADTAQAMEAMILKAAELPKEKRKDMAQLSQESKGVSETRVWDERAETAAWKRILQWFPPQGQEISQQIKELNKIYVHLLEQINSNVAAGSQAPYIDKLQQILIYQIDLLLKTATPDLQTFFRVYGTENSLCRLEASLFFAVTGRQLSLEQVKRQWDSASQTGRQYFQVQGKSGFLAGESFSSPDASSGDLYCRQGLAKKQTSLPFSSAQQLIAAASDSHSRKKDYERVGEHFYKIADLQRADRFIKAVGGTSDHLFSRAEFTSKDQSLYGLLWADEKLKLELFFQKEPVADPLRRDVGTALERMTASYVQHRNPVQKRNYAFSREPAYAVYCYTMERYQHGTKVNKAIRDGFLYALKYFLQKSGSSESAKSEEQKGFFQETISKDGLKQDLEKGSKIIEEDWKQFLSQMGYDDELLQLTASLYGPWAAIIKPEEEPDDRKKKKWESLAVAGGIAAAAVLVILAIVFL